MLYLAVVSLLYYNDQNKSRHISNYMEYYYDLQSNLTIVGFMSPRHQFTRPLSTAVPDLLCIADSMLRI